MQQVNKTLRYIFGLLLFTQVSCQNKTEKNKKMITQQEMMFDWQEGTAAPLGFPMQVYKGGLTSMDGTYVGFDNGPITGYWGQPGSGMSSGRKAVPKLLHVKWLSFAERCFYEVDVELDYDKMLKLFKDGYYTKMGELGLQKKTYDLITVGFAPGGVVVVWLSGTGRETDVGRYQGKKITIPQSEINKLDSDRAYMFKQSDWQETVDIMRTHLNSDEENNPEHLDLKKKMDNEPIPFGIWDAYRKRYNWKPVYELQNGSILDKDKTIIYYFNGEFEIIFAENFPIQKFEKRPFPKSIGFGFFDKNNVEYGAGARLNEQSVINAFKEIYGENSDNITADLVIKVNIANTFFTVTLKGSNGKEIFIKTEGLEVYKVKK